MLDKIQTTGAFLRSFWHSEEGLVTVEWVALAGSLVIGAIAVGWIVMNDLKTPANNITTAISTCASTAAGANGSTAGCTVP